MNTATIMDMMFNTEMIVKDMKGGKEDMTENKRFIIIDNVDGELGIQDNLTGDVLVLKAEHTVNAIGFFKGLLSLLNGYNQQIEQLSWIIQQYEEMVGSKGDDVE